MVENTLMKSKKKAGFRPLALCMAVSIVISQLIFTIPSFGYAVPEVNLALGKTVTASESNSIYETPDKGVNGNTDDKWCTGWTSNSKWLTVDLGEQYEINRWVVYHAGISEPSYYNTRDFRLQYSEDGTNWYTIDTVTNNTDNITERSTRTFLSRYVRLYIDYSDQGNDSCARIYDFQLYYDHDDQDSNIAFGKTATASEWNSVYETPDKGINGNIGDKWCTGWTSNSKWLMVDLGQLYEINRWVVYHAGIYEHSYYNTRDFSLQYSEDGTNWSTADTVTNNTATVTRRSTLTFMARYVRLYIDYSDQVNDSCARIYDFQLYYDQQNNIALNKTATASESWYGESPEKAFNGTYSNSQDKWCTGWSTQPKWLTVDLGEAYTIKRFKVVHAGAVETWHPEYNTRNFRIQKSSDGVNWEDVYIVIGNTSSLTEAEFPSAISARYVRLQIDQGQQDSDACARIYEFQLFSN